MPLLADEIAGLLDPRPTLDVEEDAADYACPNRAVDPGIPQGEHPLPPDSPCVHSTVTVTTCIC